jgi:hypothetical protein
MRIQFRVPKFSGDPLFELLGDEMLQTFGFLVQFVDRVIEHTEKEGLDQPVMANDLKSPLSAVFRKPDTSMRLILDEWMVGSSELLQHVGDRGRSNPEPSGQFVAPDAAVVCFAQSEDRFQVIVH